MTPDGRADATVTTTTSTTTATTTATTAPPDMRRLDVDGGAIEYTDSGGDGAALLLVHAGVFGEWFEPLARADALRTSRVIRVRRAGYTSGAPPERALSIGDHARHLATLLDDLGVATAHVVGHSSGSAIVIQLATERPDLVASMVLSEPPLVDALADPDDLEFLHAAVGPVIGGAIGAAAAGDVDAAFDSFMTVICGPDHRDVLVDALGPDAVERAIDDAAFFFADEIMAMASWQFDAAAAASIDAPALLVVGGNSAPPVHRLVAHVAALLPDATVATIPGDDHLLPLRSTDRFAQVVATFVAGRSHQHT